MTTYTLVVGGIGAVVVLAVSVLTGPMVSNQSARKAERAADAALERQAEEQFQDDPSGLEQWRQERSRAIQDRKAAHAFATALPGRIGASSDSKSRPSHRRG